MTVQKLEIHGKKFTSVSNSQNGEVSEDTLFQYYEERGIVWAKYSGGSILKGNMIGIRQNWQTLEMRYQHINLDGKIKTGICYSTITKDHKDRLHIHEKWKWTCDDFSEGESEIIEMKS